MAKIQNEMLKLGVYSLVVRGQGEDMLMGRDVKDFIEIPGLEALLKKFILDLDDYFTYIYNEQYGTFLDQIEKKFRVNISSIKDNLVNNIKEMNEVGSSEVMIYYLVITKTLEKLRQLIYGENVWNIIQETYRDLKNKNISSRNLKKLQTLDKQGNENFSLLYNLVFIKYLSEIYGNTEFSARCVALIEKEIEKLI